MQQSIMLSVANNHTRMAAGIVDTRARTRSKTMILYMRTYSLRKTPTIPITMTTTIPILSYRHTRLSATRISVYGSFKILPLDDATSSQWRSLSLISENKIN